MNLHIRAFRIIRTTTIVFLSILSIGCKHPTQRGDPFASEERDNSRFSVRVTAYREKRDFAQVLGGAEYAFEAKSSVDSEWKEFLVVKSDDAEPIQKDAITLVSDKIGYVFMITKFAVSQDSGGTWLIS